MSSQMMISTMSAAEFVLWAVLSVLFWRKKVQRRFPAMGTYLALRLISTPALVALLYGVSQPLGRDYYPVYFYLYFAVYAGSAILLFFVCMEGDAAESPGI